MRKFTKEEDDFIRQNYLTIPSKRIAKVLGRSEGTARQRMKILNIIIPPEIIQKFIEDSRYKKGSISFNKGKRQTEYMSQEAIENTKKTRFKKGSIPHNTKEKDGVISIRTDKRGVKYKFIRIGLGKWMPLSRYNWEQVHGSINSKMKIIHTDGNSLNSDLSNLQLVTPGELMKLNSYHNLPPEITQTIHLSAVLTRKINQKQKLYEKQD